jgi:hypothetical protein
MGVTVIVALMVSLAYCAVSAIVALIVVVPPDKIVSLGRYESYIITDEPDVREYTNVGVGLSVVGGVILYELSANDIVNEEKFARFGDFF